MSKSRIRSRHKGDEARRDSVLKVRFTADEMKVVRAHAAALGMPMADFMRRSLLEGGADITLVGRVFPTPPRAVPAADPELVAALARIGCNVNQIARALNIAMKSSGSVDVLAVQAQLISIELALAQVLQAQIELGRSRQASLQVQRNRMG